MTYMRRFVAGLMGLTVLSCAPQPKPDYTERLDTLREQVSFYSMQGDYGAVSDVLDQIGQIPGSEGEAAYGHALVKVVNSLSVFVELLNLVTVVSDGLAPPAQIGPQATTAGGLTDLVHAPAKQIRETFAQLDSQLRELIEQYPDDQITLNEFAIYAGKIPLIVVRGELDRSDVEVFLAASNVIQGVMALVLTQDLGLKITDIFDLLDWLKSKPYCKPSVFDDKSCLIKFGAFALETFPKMLTLAPGGVEASRASLEDLVEALQHFQNFLDFGQAETDDQADDIFTIRLQKSESGSTEDIYFFGTRNYRFATRDFFLDDTIKQGRRLVVVQSAWESSGTELSKKSIEIFNAVRQHLAGDGSRLDLQDMIRPLIEILLKSLIATDSVGEGWGSISEILQAFKTLQEKGVGPVDFVLSIVNDVLPHGMVQLDLHGLLQDGFALRSIMPHYDFRVGDDPEPYLALEWECGYDETDTLVCRAYSDVTDSTHFAGYDYSFEADDNADRLPYIAFQNPSLQGRFFLDASLAPQSVDSTPLAGTSAEAEPATNRDLNYVMHRVWDYFYKAISDAGALLAPGAVP